MKSEQLRLYNHFLNLSINGQNTIQKANCKKYANEILESYPEFKVVEPKPIEPKPIELKVVKPKEKKK